MNLNIETRRLNIRCLTEEDAPFIMQLVNEPSFLRNIGDRGVRSLEDAREYIRNGPVASYEMHGFGLFRIALKETDEPIGMCGVLKRDTLEEADLGFAFFPAYWSRGYTTESARAVLGHAHDQVGLKRVAAITLPANDRSIRALERLGFRFETLIRMSDDADELRLYLLDL